MPAERQRPQLFTWLIVSAIAGVAYSCDRSDAPAEPAPAQAATAAAPDKRAMSYTEALPVIDAYRDRLPPDLSAKTPSELESTSLRWAQQHDALVRARLARGDDDSIVNFWMFGTSFTTRPRATVADLRPRGGRAVAAEVLIGRLDDRLGALSSRGSNERLRFVREVLQQRGIDAATPAGREQARTYLIDAHERIRAENDSYRQSAESA